MAFSHHMPTRLVLGVDSLSGLSQEISGITANCLIVSGRRAARLTGVLNRIQDSLKRIHIQSILFDQVEPNPTIETVLQGAQLGRTEQVSWVLGIGGGSVIDAAKAIALMIVNQDDIREYFKGRQPANSPLPIVVIPMTAGTGSEVTPYAMVTDVAQGDKFGLSYPSLFPKLAILDPTLTLSMPEAVSIDSGLSALCHSIESLFSKRRSVFAELFARSALDRILNFLPLVRTQPDNLSVRSEMQIAATFSGMAIADTAPLVPQAAGYPVTVRYDLPHGRVSALLMPAFLERMQHQEPERVSFVGRLLGQPSDAPKALRAFIESLGVAPRLSAYGVHENDIEVFSKQTHTRGHIHRSPGDWLEETLKELYRRSL